MPKKMLTITGRRHTYWNWYSNDEIRIWWKARAPEAGPIGYSWAFSIECVEREALDLSRLWLEEVYADPSTMKYDGVTLWIDYPGSTRASEDSFRAIARAYFMGSGRVIPKGGHGDATEIISTSELEG